MSIRIIHKEDKSRSKVLSEKEVAMVCLKKSGGGYTEESVREAMFLQIKLEEGGSFPFGESWVITGEQE